MRLGLLVLPLLALPLACSFASQGEPEAGGDDELANTGTETTADGPDDELGTEQGSSESTGDGDGDPTTDTTTDEGDPTTDSSDATTDTNDTATETSTTDTTTDTTDTTDTTTDTTDTTTDTGMEETYYADCPNGGDDCAPGEVCKTDIDINDDWQVCALLCENSDECPAANGLPLTCISYGFQEKACHINCGNSDCPQGMACKSVNFGVDHICTYES